MNKILVIADDITGAAEMAGIALRHGLTVQLTTGEQYPADADAEVVVMAEMVMMMHCVVCSSK